MRDCEEVCQCDNNYRNYTIQQLQKDPPFGVWKDTHVAATPFKSFSPKRPTTYLQINICEIKDSGRVNLLIVPQRCWPSFITGHTNISQKSLPTIILPYRPLCYRSMTFSLAWLCKVETMLGDKQEGAIIPNLAQKQKWFHLHSICLPITGLPRWV